MLRIMIIGIEHMRDHRLRLQIAPAALLHHPPAFEDITRNHEA
jgi:hypothetical protein